MAIAIATSGSVEAQTAEDTLGIETIVVTAQKREQNAQEVPIAISAFGGHRLEQLAVVDISGLSNLTPNVNLDNATAFGGSQSVLVPYIRGIGSDDFAFNIDPGVGIYLDGVYLARSVGANQGLLDVERIEILKGPQGTLFGRNTIGGAISVVTKDPSTEPGGKADFTYGSDNLIQFRGLVEGPIAEGFTGSFAASYRTRDGYLKRVPFSDASAYNGSPDSAFPFVVYDAEDEGGIEDNLNLRAKLLWEGEKTKIRFSADYTRDKSTQAATLVQSTAAVAGGVFSGVTDTDIPVLDSAFPGDGPFFDLDSPASDLNGDGNPLDGLYFGSLYNYCLSVANPGVTAIQPFQGAIAGLCGTRGQIGSTLQINVPLFGNPTGMSYFDDRFVHPDIDKTYADGPNSSDLKMFGFNMTIEHDLSSVLTIKSITGYRDQEWETGIDLDGSPLNILTTTFEQDQDQFSQELQLLGTGLLDGRIDFVLGGYYFREDGFIDTGVMFSEGLLFIDGYDTFDTRNWAVFGQVEFALSDKLTVILGGRYTTEEKEFEGGQRDLNGGNYRNFPFCVDPVTGFPDPNIIIPPIPELGSRGGLACSEGVPPIPYFDPVTFRVFEAGLQRQEFDNFSPKFGLQYFANDDLQIYATYSQGYKTGGWTTRLTNPLPAAEASFEEETATTYELGAKSQIFDNRAQLNVAVFYTEYDDIQLNFQKGTSPTLQNAGDAEIFGFEADFTAVLTQNWSIQASLGYLDTRFTAIDQGVTIASGPTSLQGGIVVGGELPKAPEWQLSFSPRFETPLGNGELAIQGNYSYASETPNQVERSFSLQRDAIHLFDLIATYKFSDKPVSVTIGGKNLGDERYLVTGISNTSSGVESGTYNRGREWFLSIGMEY